MIYYKDTNNNLYAFNDNTKQEIIDRIAKKHNTTLSLITEKEYKQLKAPTLEQLKNRKKNEINKIYNIKSQEPIEYQLDSSHNYTFQADSKSQDILTKVITSAPVGFKIDWSDIDNNLINLTLDNLKQLAELILTRSQKLFIKKVTLKKQVDSVGSKKELENIKWID